MTKKTKNGIVVAAVAVVFYLIGSFAGWPNANTGLLGNIGKAKRYNKLVVNIDVDALQERLQSDTAYCKQMLASAGIMQVHADQFCALLDYSQQQFGSNKGFSLSQAAFEQVKETALNAQEAIAQFAADMGQLADGERVRNFEQDYNNALLAFNLLQQSSKVADKFVAEADAQIAKELSADNQILAALRNEWSNFAMADAIMHADELRLHQIESQGLLAQSQLSDGMLSVYYRYYVSNEKQMSDTFLPTLSDKEALADGSLTNLSLVMFGKAQLESLSEVTTLRLQEGSVLNNLLLSSEILAGNTSLSIHFVKDQMTNNAELLQLVERIHNSAENADAIDNHAKHTLLGNIATSNQLMLRDISLYESDKLTNEMLSWWPLRFNTSGFAAYVLLAQGNLSIENLSLCATAIDNNSTEQLGMFYRYVM